MTGLAAAASSQSESEDWLGERNLVAEGEFGEFVVTVSLMCIISLPNTHRVKRRKEQQSIGPDAVEQFCVNVKGDIHFIFELRASPVLCALPGHRSRARSSIAFRRRARGGV